MRKYYVLCQISTSQASEETLNYTEKDELVTTKVYYYFFTLGINDPEGFWKKIK